MIFSETSLLCTALQIIIHIVPPIRRRYENETNKLAAQKTSMLLFALKFLQSHGPNICPVVSINFTIYLV